MAEKNLSVKLSLNDKQFQSSLKKATRRLKKFGASMKRTGQTMTKSLTLPVIAFGAVAVKAFDEQIKAETKLRTSLKGNEEAFNSLKNQAQELQKVTLFGDEATMEAQGFLAQLGLNEEAILKLTPLIQDFATAQGVGLGDAAKLVAKSVGSSTNALSRYGIQIEGEVGTVDRLNSAVNALSTAFGGQAEAVSKEGLGPLVQMQNRLGDIAEEIGEKLIPIIIRLGEKLMSFLNGFSNLDSKTQEIIIGIALLTATLGPLLIVLGSIAVAIAGISAPVLATVAAVTALAAAIVFITDNWEALKERFSDISWWKNALIDMLKFFIDINPFNAIVIAFNKLRTLIGKEPIQNPFDLIKDGLEDLKVETKEYENEFNDFGTSIENSLNKVLPLISKFNKGIGLGSGGGSQKKGSAIVQDFTSFDNRVVPEQGFSLLAPITQEELDKISQAVELQKELNLQTENIASLNDSITSSFASFGNTIQGVFSQALQSSDGFFKTFVEGSKQALKAILAQLAATALLNALLGGTGAGALMGFKDIGGFAGIPKLFGFADGGLVTGATVGMIGEGPGTSMSNPEVIAPLDKLKGIIGDSGGGNVQVFGTIKGSDILLSSDRAKNNRNRTRGY
jgi:hypothetical protein